MCKLHNNPDECLKAEQLNDSEKCRNCSKQKFLVQNALHYLDIICDNCGATFRFLKDFK